MSNPPTGREPAYRAVFTRRVRDAYPDLVRFCARRVGPDSADDIAAEALATAWARRAVAPSDDDRWRAWVFGIARNHLLNAGRAAVRREALSIELERHPATTSSLSDLADLRVDLGAAWNRLTETQREALALTVWDGLTTTQAAAVLGISPIAYRVRVSRARAALRAHLHVTAPTRAAATLSCEGSSS